MVKSEGLLGGRRSRAVLILNMNVTGIQHSPVIFNGHVLFCKKQNWIVLSLFLEG